MVATSPLLSLHTRSYLLAQLYLACLSKENREYGQKKGFEKKIVKEQKQKLNRDVIVSKDADQLQGCSQEVGRNNWKEVL